MRSLLPLVCLMSLLVAAADLSAKIARPVGKALFDGKTLAGWESIDFPRAGKVHVKDGSLVMEKGTQMTGVFYKKGDFPKRDYEVSFAGKKLDGDDFFCTTTFPVGDSHCSLVVGGWGGTVVGLSSINGVDASENETNTSKEFAKDRWYQVRIRVTKDRIAAWIDKEKLIDLATEDKKISLRIECYPCRPFGFATWSTAGAVRDVRVRALTEAEKKEKAAVKE